MSRPYSEDLRTRLVAAVEDGQSCRSAAAQFSVGVSTAIRWVGRYRRTGSVKASRMGGRRPPRIVGADREWLLARLAEQPDLTLEEMRRALAEERGLLVGHGTIWRFCQREQQTLKKRRYMRRSKIVPTLLKLVPVG